MLGVCVCACVCVRACVCVCVGESRVSHSESLASQVSSLRATSKATHGIVHLCQISSRQTPPSRFSGYLLTWLVASR
jgi:hypothetical protein